MSETKRNLPDQPHAFTLGGEGGDLSWSSIGQRKNLLAHDQTETQNPKVKGDG